MNSIGSLPLNRWASFSSFWNADNNICAKTWSEVSLEIGSSSKIVGFPLFIRVKGFTVFFFLANHRFSFDVRFDCWPIVMEWTNEYLIKWSDAHLYLKLCAPLVLLWQTDRLIQCLMMQLCPIFYLVFEVSDGIAEVFDSDGFSFCVRVVSL